MSELDLTETYLSQRQSRPFDSEVETNTRYSSAFERQALVSRLLLEHRRLRKANVSTLGQLSTIAVHHKLGQW
jgi:hypothetical protein